MVSIASAQGIRSNLPSPFAPIRRSGYSQTLRRILAIEIPRNFAAQKATCDRVVRVAPEFGADAVFYVDQ